MAQLHKNIGFAGIGQFLYTILAFILIPFATRYLDSDGYGLYTLAATLGFFVSLLTDLGLSVLITREVSKNSRLARRMFSYVLGVKTALLPAALALLFVYLYWGRFDSIGIHTIVIFTLSSIVGSYSQTMFAIFRGYEKIQYETLGVFIDKFLSVVIGIAVLVLGGDIRLFVSAFLLAAVVKFVLSAVILKRRFFRPRIRWNPVRSKILVKTAVAFGISAFLAMCYNYLDVIMLSVMTTLDDVGLYSVSYKLLALTTIIPTVLTTAFLPQLSVQFRNREKLTELFLKGAGFLFLFSLPMIPFVLFLSGDIIHLVSGPGWDGSVISLQILVFAAFAQMLNSFFVPLYAAVNHQNRIMIFQIVGLVLNVVLNLLLIPIISYRGAAIATVATEWCILFLIVIWAVKNIFSSLGVYADTGFLTRVAAATALMSLFLLGTQFIEFAGIIRLITTICIYGIALQLCGCIDYFKIASNAVRFLKSTGK